METFITIVLICILLSPVYFVYWLRKRQKNTEVGKRMAELSDKEAQKNRWLSSKDLFSDNGACPKCECKEWKLASLVNAEGISAISTSTLGVGAGAGNDIFGEGVGLGAGIGKTRGSQQTMLSELAAPPEKPISVKWMTIAMIGIAILGLIMEWTIVFVIFGVFAAFGILALLINPKIDKEAKKKFDKANAKYSDKRICLRCGALYYSNQKQFVGTPSSSTLESNSMETKKCPYCAETIQAAAILCKHCHSKL